MNTLRSQLDEIFHGTLDEGTGLLRLVAKSENIESEWPRELAERMVRPMEAIRRVEASLIRDRWRSIPSVLSRCLQVVSTGERS